MTLPPGFRVRVRPAVQQVGHTLVGGSPPTVLRLADRAARVIPAPGEILSVGDPVTARVAETLMAANLADPVPTDAPGSLEELTVVVPVHDRPEVLARCLTAVSHPDVRVVVVDDHSEDAAGIAAVADRHGARVLRHDTNRGPAAARNTGRRSVRTPFVAFVDVDVQARPDDLGRLLAYFADPRLALIAPRILGRPTTDHPRWWERYDLVHGSLDRGAVPAHVRAGAGVAWVPSACLVARAEALGDGFAADLRVGEDVDLVWRLLAAGHRVRYAADVVVRHDTRASLWGWSGRKVAYGRSAAPLTRRHPDRMAVAVFTGPQMIAAVALLVPGWWTVPALVTAWVLTVRRIRPVLPDGSAGRVLAGRLAMRAVRLTAGQVSGLLLRHWWPLTLVALLISRRVRCTVVVAALVDLAVRRRTREASAQGLGPVAHLIGARLDDVAYGLGLWQGAWRARSVRALLPRLTKP